MSLTLRSGTCANGRIWYSGYFLIIELDRTLPSVNAFKMFESPLRKRQVETETKVAHHLHDLTFGK